MGCPMFELSYVGRYVDQVEFEEGLRRKRMRGKRGNSRSLLPHLLRNCSTGRCDVQMHGTEPSYVCTVPLCGRRTKLRQRSRGVKVIVGAHLPYIVQPSFPIE